MRTISCLGNVARLLGGQPGLNTHLRIPWILKKDFKVPGQASCESI
jgi:hypothetical protein